MPLLFGKRARASTTSVAQTPRLPTRRRAAPSGHRQGQRGKVDQPSEAACSRSFSACNARWLNQFWRLWPKSATDTGESPKRNPAGGGKPRRVRPMSLGVRPERVTGTAARSRDSARSPLGVSSARPPLPPRRAWRAGAQSAPAVWRSPRPRSGVLERVRDSPDPQALTLAAQVLPGAGGARAGADGDARHNRVRCLAAPRPSHKGARTQASDVKAQAVLPGCRSASHDPAPDHGRKGSGCARSGVHGVGGAARQHRPSCGFRARCSGVSLEPGGG
jgi:hypothetical protein